MYTQMSLSFPELPFNVYAVVSFVDTTNDIPW